MLYKLVCNICGDEFTAITKFKRNCPKCDVELYRSKQDQKQRAQKSESNIREDTKEAEKRGLTYGVYKAKFPKREAVK